MHPVELHLIEKRFVKLLLEKNYVTGEKHLTYIYLNKDDHAWHKERLESTKWEQLSAINRKIIIDGKEIKVIKVRYAKIEKPDWQKQKIKKEKSQG